MRAVEFDKIKFCFDFCFPKAAEAVRSRQLQSDQLTFQRINRVVDLTTFREILARIFPDR